MVLAGRGWGKTRTGAEAVAKFAFENPNSRIAVVAPTARDLRLVCLEGDSGLMGILPPEAFLSHSPEKGYNKTLGEIKLANGVIVQGYSGEEPGRLRGPQHGFAWADEIAAWQRPQDTWDMLQFGLRLGGRPRSVITTTPRPIPLLYALKDDPSTVVTSGSTYDNAPNLAKSFLKTITQYEGTELGRQEIHAELISLDTNAIIKRHWWNPWREEALPDKDDLILSFASLDPAYTEKDENDPSACTVWYVYRDRDRNDKILLRYAWEERLEFNSLVEHVKDTIDHFGITRVLVEGKASGLSVIQELRRQRHEIAVHQWKPVGDKTARLHAVSPMFAKGLVSAVQKLDNKGQWVWRDSAEKVIKQCAMFPASPHDDLVDTVSQALQWIRSQNLDLFEQDRDPIPMYRHTIQRALY